MSQLQIIIALYPGVTHLDFTGPHQVLVRTPNAKVTAASMGGQAIEAEGLTFSNLADLTKLERCDVLLIPGGFGTAAAMLDEAFVAELRRLGGGAKYLTSVCTGSLLLGAAGVLEGKRATSHWLSYDHLASYGATPTEERVVIDGKVITGAGVSAGIDMALVLAEKLAGREVAEAIQLGIEYDPQPPFNAGAPSKAPAEIRDLVSALMGAVEESVMAEPASP